MATVLFELKHERGYSVKKSESLKEILKHIRMFINEPRSWMVQQIDNRGNLQCGISAYYLIENFKTEQSLPEKVSDIKFNSGGEAKKERLEIGMMTNRGLITGVRDYSGELNGRMFDGNWTDGFEGAISEYKLKKIIN